MLLNEHTHPGAESPRLVPPAQQRSMVPNLLMEFVAAAAGSHFTLRLTQLDDPKRHLDNAFALPDGRLAYLSTAAGLAVRRLCKGFYQLANVPALILTANDPDAP